MSSRFSQGEREFVLDTQPPSADGRTVPIPQPSQEVDARGLSSPLPILRAHRALRAMPPMQVLKVVSTEAQSVPEFQALVKYVTNYELLAQDESNGEYVHLLRRRR
jgi:tRNA 2-thiouridine synthesizing protein A